MTNRPAPNEYQRTAAWIFLALIAILVIMLLFGDWKMFLASLIGGLLSAAIGIAWERGN